MSIMLDCKEPTNIMFELSPGGEALGRNYPLSQHRKREEHVQAEQDLVCMGDFGSKLGLGCDSKGAQSP